MSDPFRPVALLQGKWLESLTQSPRHVAFLFPPYDPTELIPRAPLGTPVRNPCLARLATNFNDRIRPVPVVLRCLAFSPQLTVYVVRELAFAL